MNNDTNEIFILDGHGLIFRSYFAHIRNPLMNQRGENTSAIFGFFQAIKKIFSMYAPKLFVVALDSSGDTFRSEIYKEYKANRQKTPEDLKSQIPKIIEILDSLKIPYIAETKMEADDLIASIVNQAQSQNIKTTIISSDKDLFQLLGENVRMLRPTSKSSDWEVITVQWLAKEWGISPKQVVDYQAIIGDTSDNVPGVAGIGPKSAMPLLQEYQSLDNIYKNIDSIKETWKKKLLENKENAFLSYKLVRLNNQLEIPSFDNFEYDTVPWELAKKQFIDNDIFAFAGSSSSKDTSSKEKKTPHKHLLVTDEKQLHDLVNISQLKNTSHVCMEITTDSSDPITALPVGIALSNSDTSGYYIPLHCEEEGKVLSEEIVKPWLQAIINSPVTIIMHNAKFSISVLTNWGISFELLFQRIEESKRKSNTLPQIFDTTLASWLCFPDAFSYTLENVAKKILQYEAIEEFNPEKNYISFSKNSLVESTHNLAEQTIVAYKLFNALKKTLEELGLYELYTTLEIPLLLLIVQIERFGVLVDDKYLNNLSTQLQKSFSILQKEIFQLSGEEFNINSPQQLQTILFETLGLPTGKKTKKGYSTDNSVLEFLLPHHPIIEKIIEFRHLGKLKSTYTDALPLQINPQTKRIHTSLQQIGTETGRISSINPNLQNIPVKDEWGKKIRSSFIASKGNALVSADYAQIELKVLAHLSGDANLIDAFQNGVDIHKRTASLLFGISEQQVNDDQRRIAKTINFGIVYGMSAFQLSNDLKISQHDAKMFIEAYFLEFEGVTNFIKQTIENTEKQGKIQTLLGRIRPIHNINSSNKPLKKAAERVAVNSIIQGSAADIVKLAMLQVHNSLLEHSLKSRIILQIHDELLIESPNNEVKKVMTLVPQIMEHAYKLSIPIQVSINSDTNWGALK